jgi:hypothetical protein
MKILAIALVALILSITIAATAQSVRAEGLLSDFFDMVKKWFDSSPLGNLFTAPVKRNEFIRLAFYPETFDFSTADLINITTATGEISNFKGTASVDMKNKALYFKESGSSLVIKETIGIINVDNLKISSLELKDMKLSLVSGNWNETTESGSISISDFLGKATIKDDYIEIEGNVSRLVKG